MRQLQTSRDKSISSRAEIVDFVAANFAAGTRTAQCILKGPQKDKIVPEAHESADATIEGFEMWLLQAQPSHMLFRRNMKSFHPELKP
jgi:hypothetical protein